MTNFSNNIRLIRLKRNLKQSFVANQLGVSVRTYRDIENGKRSPSIELAQKIADVYEIDLRELLNEA